MNPVAKKLWVDRLEAMPDSAQSFGPLRETVGNGLYKFCAIGALVACYCEAHDKPWSEVAKGLDVDEEVFVWAAYNPWTELVKAGEITGRVFDLNDHFKIPFRVIAEGIRREL